MKELAVMLCLIGLSAAVCAVLQPLIAYNKEVELLKQIAAHDQEVIDAAVVYVIEEVEREKNLD